MKTQHNQDDLDDKVQAQVNAEDAAQHTPGPWEVSRDGPEWLVGPTCNAPRVAIINGLYADTDNSTPAANARLITAAPQLLAAAKRALEYLTDHGLDLDGHEEEIVAGIRADLDDAITKAKGE